MKPEDISTISSAELLAKFELENLDLILREKRLRWIGHEEHFSGAVIARANPSSEFVEANTLAKWKKLEPYEIDFSQGFSLGK